MRGEAQWRTSIPYDDLDFKDDLANLFHMHHIPTVEGHMEIKIDICKPTSNSYSSEQILKQFYHTELRLKEPMQQLIKP